MKEDDLTVCMRVSRREMELTIDGSFKSNCSECDKKVWVSPATHQAIKEGIYPSKLVCINCFNKKVNEK